MPQSVVPPSPTEPPPGFAVAPNEARAAAERVEAVQAARREHPGLRSTVAVPTAGGDPRTYQVGYFTPLERSQYGSDIRVEVVVSGVSGEVLEVWTGPQAAPRWPAAASPRWAALNKPWVWLPLAALFLLPFVDPRRPLRLVHLDLLVLLDLASPSSTSTRAASRSRCRSCTRCSPTCWCAPCWPGSGRGLGGGARALAADALAGGRARAARRLPGRAQRAGLDRDRRGLREHGRRRPNRARRGALRAERGARRHLRAGQLPRLPAVRGAAALGRKLGRRAGRARRGGRSSTCSRSSA